MEIFKAIIIICCLPSCVAFFFASITHIFYCIYIYIYRTILYIKYASKSSFGCYLNFFMTKVLIILRPVHWFTLQIFFLCSATQKKISVVQTHFCILSALFENKLISTFKIVFCVWLCKLLLWKKKTVWQKKKLYYCILHIKIFSTNVPFLFSLKTSEH